MKVERYINGKKATKEELTKKKIDLNKVLQVVRNFK